MVIPAQRKWQKATELFKPLWQMDETDEKLWRIWADFCVEAPASVDLLGPMMRNEGLRLPFKARVWMVNLCPAATLLPFYWPNKGTRPSEIRWEIIKQWHEWLDDRLNPLVAELVLALIDGMPGLTAKSWLAEQNPADLEFPLPPANSLVDFGLMRAGEFLLKYLNSLTSHEQARFWLRIPWPKLLTVISSFYWSMEGAIIEQIPSLSNLDLGVRKLLDQYIRLWLESQEISWTERYWGSILASGQPDEMWPEQIVYMLATKPRRQMLHIYEPDQLVQILEVLDEADSDLSVALLKVELAKNLQPWDDENDFRSLDSDTTRYLIEIYGGLDAELDQLLAKLLQVLEEERRHSLQHQAEMSEHMRWEAVYRERYRQILAAME